MKDDRRSFKKDLLSVIGIVLIIWSGLGVVCLCINIMSPYIDNVDLVNRIVFVFGIAAAFVVPLLIILPHAIVYGFCWDEKEDES